MQNNSPLLIEFEKFKLRCQQLEEAGKSLMAGNSDSGLASLKSTLVDLDKDEKESTDPDIKEAQQMLTEVIYQQLALLTDTSSSPESQQEKLVQFQKLNANLQSKILVIITKISANQNPTIANRFTVWISKLVDRFRV